MGRTFTRTGMGKTGTKQVEDAGVIKSGLSVARTPIRSRHTPYKPKAKVRFQAPVESYSVALYLPVLVKVLSSTLFKSVLSNSKHSNSLTEQLFKE
jgi:hypothetical protein